MGIASPQMRETHGFLDKTVEEWSKLPGFTGTKGHTVDVLGHSLGVQNNVGMGAVLLDDKINHGLKLGGILNIDGMCGALGVRYAAEQMYEQDKSRAVEEYARMLNDRIISPSIDPPNPNTSLSPYFSQTPPWMSPAGQPVTITPIAVLQNWHDNGWLEDKTHPIMDWFKRFSETARGLSTYHQIGCIDNLLLQHGHARELGGKTDTLILRGPPLGIREMFEPDQGYKLTKALTNAANFVRLTTGVLSKLTNHQQEPGNFLGYGGQPSQPETPLPEKKEGLFGAVRHLLHLDATRAAPSPNNSPTPDYTPLQDAPPGGRGPSLAN